MAKLTEDQKQFLVTKFACFHTLAQVQALFEESFGLKIEKTQANRYDMSGWAARDGKGGVSHWKAMHDAIRDEYAATLAQIPIAQKAFRLTQLGAMFNTAITGNGSGRPNIPLAAQLLEQAAKESGGTFTNETKVTHKGRVEVEERSPEDTRAMLEARIGAAIEAVTTKH